ncbi:MAG: hypothetical protein ABSC05_37190 [Candidatus Solibacter sp.]|jgi:hypothetical protein
MRKTIVILMLACAGQMFAGGFWLQVGNPEANAAVGVVNGERRAIPLELKPLGEPGAWALAQQWPKEGKWVIQLVGRNGEQFTNTLIGAGPGGIDRLHARLDMKAFAASDVEAMLK